MQRKITNLLDGARLVEIALMRDGSVFIATPDRLRERLIQIRIHVSSQGGLRVAGSGLDETREGVYSTVVSATLCGPALLDSLCAEVDSQSH